jgi:16S rRNA (guanine527-N7)-methyltransferase
LSGTDASGAATLARLELERLLDAEPALRDLLPPGFADAAEAHVRLLLEANARVNLTRVVEPAEVARFHLLDALAALPLLDASGAAQAIDLGSGGGVPAIPLALARPDVAWILVDSIGKKAVLLEGFVAELGLPNVRVSAARAEDLGRDRRHRERYDVATARACAALPVLVELALPLVRVEGQLLAWKGPMAEGDEELQRGRVAAGQVGGGRIEVRSTGLAALGNHTFVTVPKRAPTPQRFPRRPGEPGRRPLG